MDLVFEVGDRVRLARAAYALYGGAWPHYCPQGQGGGSAGTILFAGERPHKPGAAPRPYYVRWDNGIENSYRVDDLVADDPADETGADSNIIPFSPRKS